MNIIRPIKLLKIEPLFEPKCKQQVNYENPL